MDLQTSHKINKYLLEKQSEFFNFIIKAIEKDFGKHPMKDIRLKSRILIDKIKIKRDDDINHFEKYILELKKEFENEKL